MSHVLHDDMSYDYGIPKKPYTFTRRALYKVECRFGKGKIKKITSNASDTVSML